LNNSGGSFGFSLSCNEGIMFFTQAACNEAMEVLLLSPMPPSLISIDEGSLLAGCYCTVKKKNIFYRTEKF